MSSSLFKQFKTDSTKETEGIEIKYAPNTDGTEPTFRIRRRGQSNQQYAKALQRESQPYRRQIELNVLDDMMSRQILVKAFCTAVLVGWANVQDSDGKVIPFNRENAIRLFGELPELYDDLNDQSGRISLFRLDEAENEVKN